ncbi:MAG: HD domain-containing protein, partial [Holophagales bacterium]|nr:HD domain-containing protein [Holophagales bacterium]
ISSALEAIDFGAEDYILKPFNLDTLSYSLQRVFERRQLEEENKRYQEQLEAEVRSRTSEVHQASRKIGAVFYKIVHVLGNSQECREPFLRGRTERVTIMSLRTAEKLGWGQDRMQELLLAAPISDVGKMAISESVLNKPSPLTSEEITAVRDHVIAGERIVNSLAHFKRVAPVIRLHHERYNGAGYPNGLRGHEIPDTAALVAIVDSFDAMTHARPWRPAKKYDEALSELRKLSGTEYNPRLVEAFIAAAAENDFASQIDTKPTKEFYELTLPLLEHIEYLYEDH